MKLKNKNDSPVTLRISDVIYNYLNINFDTQMIL